MSLDKHSPDKEALGRLGIVGHPWHGLCTNGVLALPNGTTKTYPQPASGDAHVLRVPGVPEVTRTPEEAAADSAAGRTWLNYAILSGSACQLYSKALGAGRWIYADEAGDRWLVTTTLHGATVAGLESAGTITVTLARFGVVGGAPATYTHVVTVPALGQDSPVLYNPAVSTETILVKSAISARLVTFNARGGAAAFRLGVDVPVLLRNTQMQFRPCGWLEIQISGAGSAALVTLSVLKTRAQTVGESQLTAALTTTVLYQTVTETTTYVDAAPFPTCGGLRVRYTTTSTFEAELVGGDPDLDVGDTHQALAWPTAEGVYPITRGTRQHMAEWVIGVGYDVAGTLEYITARYTIDQTLDCTQELIVDAERYIEESWVAGSSACQVGGVVTSIARAYRVQHTETASSVLTISLRRNGVEFDSFVSPAVVTEHAAEFDGAGTVPAYDLTGPMSNSTTCGTDTRDGRAGFDQWFLSESYLDQRALIAMETVGRIGTTTGASYLAWVFCAQPYTANVFGFQRRRRVGETTGSYSDQHEIEAQSVSTTGAVVYASRHPVTGALAVNTVPVCWV